MVKTMIKKFSLMMVLVLTPVSSVFANEVFSNAEMEAYEDQMDVAAMQKFGAQAMARRGGSEDRDRGAEVAIGVIGAIVDVIADETNGRHDRRRPPGGVPGSSEDDDRWNRTPAPRPPGHGDGWGHPGDGWDRPDRPGRPGRQIVCYARNARGQYFQAVGMIRHRVERRAMSICQEYSRRCFPAGCRGAR